MPFELILSIRIDPDEARIFCYTVEELVVVDFRLTFIWSDHRVPGA